MGHLIQVQVPATENGHACGLLLLLLLKSLRLDADAILLREVHSLRNVLKKQ